MIALIIIGALLLLILLILFLPLNVFVSFKNEFYVKIKFVGIKVYELLDERDKQKKRNKKSNDSKDKPQKTDTLNEAKGIFKFLKEKYGFFGAVKKLLGLFSEMLKHIKKQLKRIKFKNIKVDITVSGDDAADTAIKYGAVCSGVYPVLSFIDSFSTVEFKKIDIRSDFAENKKEFEFSFKIKLQIIYLLIAIFKIYTDYKNFTLKENYDERK